MNIGSTSNYFASVKVNRGSLLQGQEEISIHTFPPDLNLRGCPCCSSLAITQSPRMRAPCRGEDCWVQKQGPGNFSLSWSSCACNKIQPWTFQLCKTTRSLFYLSPLQISVIYNQESLVWKSLASLQYNTLNLIFNTVPIEHFTLPSFICSS